MKTIKNREKRKEAEKDLHKKIMLFDRLPDSCVACKKEFDKTDIDMVRSWTVVVRNKENIVNLYCPPCIESAKKVIEDFKKKKIDDFRQSKKEQKQDG